MEGTLEDFLGVKIYRIKDGFTHLVQPYLIQKIVKELGKENPKIPSKPIPEQPFKILHPH